LSAQMPFACVRHPSLLIIHQTRANMHDPVVMYQLCLAAPHASYTIAEVIRHMGVGYTPHVSADTMVC
jgi:hypothetical protein